MRRGLLILWLHFVLIISINAQFSAPPLIQNYGTENGMPSNGVKGMFWDESTGFLWMATEAGIVRFNGVDFNTYTRTQIPELASERTLFLTRDFSGKAFISDVAGNIFSIDQSVPVPWYKPKTQVNPYYDNYYLFSVSEKFFQNNQDKNDKYLLSPVVSITAAVSDTSCLISHSSFLFFHSISQKEPIKLSASKDHYRSVFKIGDNILVFTKEGYLVRFNPVDRSFTPINFVDEYKLNFDNQNREYGFFWDMGMEEPVLIQGDKAYLFTYSKDTVRTKLIFENIPHGALIRFVQYSEKYHILFMGTDSRGLIVLRQPRVLPRKRIVPSSSKRNSYYAQIEWPDGNITTNEGDVIGDAKMQASYPISGKFSETISKIGDSLIWYSQAVPNTNHNALYCFNIKTNETKKYEEVRLAELVAYSGSKIYTASPKGLGILENNKIRMLYSYDGPSFGKGLFAFGELEPGILGLASCEGLLRFNTITNKLDTLYFDPTSCIRTFWKYGDYTFLGTYGKGYMAYKKGGRIKSMPFDKNQYLRYTHCFQPDNNGFCWISTNRGLFKASINDMISAYDGDLSQIYYHYIGKNDGMDITEMNGGCMPCALQLKNKNLSFPTMDGLLWVNPFNDNLQLPEGSIYLDEFRAGTHLIHPDSVMHLSFGPKDNDIQLRLGYSSWCNKENIYLDYQLNNSEWKPVDISGGAFINLSNLNPGKYKLQIRKLNGFGINNYSYKEINFSIKTPWNRQWWFFLAICLIVFAILAIYLQFRTRQLQISQRKLEKQVADKTRELKEQNEILEKNNTIKSRLISIISHDIITPLKFLTVAGKNLQEKKKLMTEDLQQETIREMTNTSQELQLLSTNILNWIKYQNENRRMAKETFNLHEMVSQVLGLLNSLAKQKNLQIENEVDPALDVHQFYEPLKILVYNLLTNAIQFTEKGSIKVKAGTKAESLIVSVSDEGTGMTPEQVQRILADEVVITSANVDNKKGHGLGYLIIKDLVKTMGARIEIESKKGFGTTVSVITPLKNGN